MAIVRKRTLPSGETRWIADYVDAKGVRRSKQFKRKADAEGYLVGVRGDLQRGMHVAPGASITVNEAGRLWLERAQRDRLVPQPFASISSTFRTISSRRWGAPNFPILPRLEFTNSPMAS